MAQLLNTDILKDEARQFAEAESRFHEPSLYGVTDGKAVGTYLEHKFQDNLRATYEFPSGNSARGIDFPELNVDIKVTSIRQPQSSCPFKSAREKIYGLGYDLLVFVYEKYDNHDERTGNLNIRHVIYIDAAQTADYQTTRGLRSIVENDGNKDDLIAFMHDRLLPVDEIQAEQLAEELIEDPPELGYLTISNALQWRLQYRRVIDEAGQHSGLYRIV